MTATQIAPELSTRLDTIIEDETATFLQRQRRSEEMSGRATALAGGATSSWQVAEPHAVWLSHGDGSKLYDVDGNEYSDFHGGYGVSLAGHNHPAIVAAVRERVGKGTHFAQPTEDSIVVAEQPRPALRPAAVALRQLRHRVDDGRRTPDARRHGSRADHQARGRLPRSPRLRDGLGAARERRRPRSGRRPDRHPGEHRTAQGHDRRHRDRPRQQPSRRRGRARALPRRDRGHDRRADHDERRDHHPRRRLPRGPQGPAARPRRPA